MCTFLCSVFIPNGKVVKLSVKHQNMDCYAHRLSVGRCACRRQDSVAPSTKRDPFKQGVTSTTRNWRRKIKRSSPHTEVYPVSRAYLTMQLHLHLMPPPIV